jgi:hypothetical protein
MVHLKETGLSRPRMVMRGRWRRACGGGLVVAGFFAVPADAQDLPDLQRELQDMRRHYDAELKRLRRDYETRIERLEKQVKAAEGAPQFKARDRGDGGTIQPVPGRHAGRARDKCRSEQTGTCLYRHPPLPHRVGASLASTFNPRSG